MLVGGHLGIAGTASGDALILSRMPQAFERLTVNGAHLVLVIIPPSTAA